VVACAGDADTQVRGAVARYVARVEGLPALPRLLALAADKDASVAYAAIHAIAGIEDKETLLEKLAEQLTSGEPTTKPAIARVLAELKDTRALLTLIELSKNSDIETRRAAIEGLGKYKDDRAVSALFEALRDSNVEFYASNALRRFDPLDFRQQFEDALLNGPEPGRVAQVLAAHGDRKGLPVLDDLLTSRNGDIVEKASRSLTSLSGPRVLRALLSAHDKPALWLSLQVSVVLKMKAVELATGVAKLLDSLDAQERAAAARLLGDFQVPDAMAPLERLEHDSDETVRETAKSSRRRLSDLLQTQDTPEPEQAVSAGRVVKPANALERLLSFFKRS
jgi:HEAT repeat protein